jgi:hypothetical protein
VNNAAASAQLMPLRSLATAHSVRALAIAIGIAIGIEFGIEFGAEKRGFSAINR